MEQVCGLGGQDSLSASLLLHKVESPGCPWVRDGRCSAGASERLSDAMSWAAARAGAGGAAGDVLGSAA